MNDERNEQREGNQDKRDEQKEPKLSEEERRILNEMNATTEVLERVLAAAKSPK